MRHSNSILIHLVTLICLSLGLFLSLSYTSLLHAQEQADKAADTEKVMPNKKAARQISQLEQMIAMEAELKSSETTWLGEDEQRFLSLYRPALAPSQMAIILLPDSLHKLSQPNLMLRLYKELPMADWSTLAIAMPEALEVAPMIETFKPSTPESTEQTSEEAAPDPATDPDTEDKAADASGKNEDSSEPAAAEGDKENSALNRIIAGSEFLQSKDIQAVTFVAENLTAKTAIEASLEQKDKVSGLVFWQVDVSELPMEQLKKLNESRITLLDIVYHDISAEEKTERIRFFKMAGFDNDYRLITSPYGQAGFAQSQRRVRQWLESSFQKYLGQ